MEPLQGIATGVGSFPYDNAPAAIEFIRNCLPDIPHWPQLPPLSPKENMYLQYAEGLPCTVIDEDAGKIIFNTADDIFGPLEKFYTRFLEHDLEYFSISRPYAAGLYALLDSIDGKVPRLKGQSLGPISFGLTVTDQDKRASFYHDQLRDVIIKHFALKAEWQAALLSKYADEVIIFIDEPYLASFGSAYISLSKEDVVQCLNEVADAIRAGGATPGVHCCANTQWSILMETNIDILNFDAYEFAANMQLYPEAINTFFANGGNLAWGVIPTSEKIEREDGDSLFTRLNEEIAKFVAHGVDETALRERLIITGSCGTGSLTRGQAERVYEMSAEVSRRLRNSQC